VQTVKQTLNPEFNETFHFTIPRTANAPKYHLLHISVWDWDRFTKDEFLGQAWVFLGHLRSDVSHKHENEWITLLPATVIDPMTPTLELVRHNFSIHTYKSPTWCAACDGLLWGAVRQGLQCRECLLNVHEKCRALVPDNCRGDKLARHRRRFLGGTTLTPAQEYVLMVQDALLSDILDEAHSSKGATSTNELVGQLRLRMRYTEEPVLPRADYDPLLDLALDSDMYLLDLLQACTIQKEDVARALVSIYESRGEAPALLLALARKDILGTRDVNTIFRSNTLATKAYDAYMKLHGKEYLLRTLGDTVRAVVAEPSSFEVDPLRCTNPKDLERNWKTLIKHATDFIDATFRSVSTMPLVFKVCCLAGDEWSHNDDMSSRCSRRLPSRHCVARFYCDSRRTLWCAILPSAVSCFCGFFALRSSARSSSGSWMQSHRPKPPAASR
jgi:hypothetical protein